MNSVTALSPCLRKKHLNVLFSEATKTLLKDSNEKDVIKYGGSAVSVRKFKR